MKRVLFKQIISTSLLVMIAGVVSFCVFAGAVSGGEMDHGDFLNRDMLASHFLSVKELTLAVFATPLLLPIILLAAVFIYFFYLRERDLFLGLPLPHYLKHRRRDALSVIKSTIYYWLSLFERSPNFMMPA